VDLERPSDRAPVPTGPLPLATAASSASPDEGEALLSFDLRRYFEALRRYIWVVLAIVAVAVTGAVIYTQRQPKVFEARASVQIEPRMPDLLGQGQDLLSTGAGAGGAGLDYYKQQRQILSSYKITRQTVEQNALHLKLLSDRERADLELKDQVDLATRRAQQSITVKYPDQDRIMYVTVRNESPTVAAEIANAHVQSYVDYTQGQLTDDTVSASSVLALEFEKAESALRDAEQDLYKFQKEKDLLAVSLEDRQSMVSSNITSYSQRVNDARARQIEIGSKLDRMREAATLDVLESPVLLMAESASFEALRAQYYAERNRLKELAKPFGTKHPDYQAQAAKVDDLLEALRGETRRMVAAVGEQHKAALSTERRLQLELDRATKDALALGPDIAAYNDKLRKKKSVEDRYNLLRNRLAASDLTGSMNRYLKTSYAKALDRALVPTAPVSPSMRVNVVAAGLFSLFMGLGVVLLLVFLDRSVKSTTDAQQAAAAPVLGVIPIISDDQLPRNDDRARDLYVHEHPTSAVAECCRSLRTNILFTSAERQFKTIVVSSANEREGKTTTVIYLGTIMAQSAERHQRVLLIDTDMRRPRLHASTGVPRGKGISNLILGDDDYDAVIKTTEIPNLFVLPCGPLPPNPAELLMTKRFGVVLAELARRFDRIILDSPPIGAVTDAVVLSKQCDGVLLVAQAGKTLREELKRSARQIRDVGGTTLGVIVNAIDDSGKGAYGGGYYGYRAEAEEPS
jgi:capsular exopolysaccharide synthesis family protein